LAGSHHSSRQQQHGVLARCILGRPTNQESRAASSEKGINRGGGRCNKEEAHVPGVKEKGRNRRPMTIDRLFAAVFVFFVVLGGAEIPTTTAPYCQCHSLIADHSVVVSWSPASDRTDRVDTYTHLCAVPPWSCADSFQSELFLALAVRPWKKVGRSLSRIKLSLYSILYSISVINRDIYRTVSTK
jgi:hypothetical protein